MADIDATIFSKSRVYLDREFEFILTQIYTCFKMMLVDYSEVENNENKIRNRLYRDYLKKAKLKEALGLGSYIFHPEVPEIDDNYNESSRTDIMVYNCRNYLVDETAYYIIECKRIDGSKNLNDKYVSNGINRFIEDRYPSNKNVNAMLGFVVEAIDISQNIMNFSELRAYSFIQDLKFSYISSHISHKLNAFTLYHIMLDFSRLIK